MGCSGDSCTMEMGNAQTFTGCPALGDKVWFVNGEKVNGKFVYGWRVFSDLIKCYIRGSICVVAGGGYPDSPVVDSDTYQNDLLKGIGNTGDDGIAKIQIIVNNQPMCNFGINANFDFDNVEGRITFYADGYRFGQDSSLYINLNQ